MNGITITLAAAASLWIAFALGIHLLSRPNIRIDNPFACFLFRVIHGYARAVHGLTVQGRENIPVRPSLPTQPGEQSGLLVVINHTSAVDPLVVQAAFNYEIRWIMALDMATPEQKWLWDAAKVILIDRRVNESAPLREAIKHMKAGGVIGVFPEGFIERPPHVIFPFREGVGLLASRPGVKVLPVVVDGTPQTEPVGNAVWTPSQTTLRILPLIDYVSQKLGAAEIAADLRRRFVEATGWPTSDKTPRWENDHWVDVGLDGREIVRT